VARRVRRRDARSDDGDDRRARERAVGDEHAADKTPAAPEAAWPSDTFFDEFHKLLGVRERRAVILYYAPAANTDGDSFVFFRHSEVIAPGNLFSTISYPLDRHAKGRHHSRA
jgi:hypothetical protein